jgi:hypothetical protein
MGDHHDDHDDTAYLLKTGRVHLSLEELSNLLRSVQKPTNAPKSGTRGSHFLFYFFYFPD